MKKPSISFFCPAYFDEGNLPILIPEVYKLLKNLAAKFEIIIVEDGSPDNTGKIADKLAFRFKPFIKVVHHPKNLGYGAALKSGFTHAKKFDYVFYTDGDNQYNVNELSKMLPYIGNYDAVIGFRAKRALTLSRQIQTKVYNLLVRLLFGLRVKDINCSMKVIKRKMLRGIKLESDSSFIEAELLIKLKQRHFKIKEIEVSHFPRRFGKASGGSIRVILGTLLDIGRFYKDSLRTPGV